MINKNKHLSFYIRDLADVFRNWHVCVFLQFFYLIITISIFPVDKEIFICCSFSHCDLKCPVIFKIIDQYGLIVHGLARNWTAYLEE